MVAVDFDHQSSHLGTIMMIISLRLGTIRILFIAEPSSISYLRQVQVRRLTKVKVYRDFSLYTGRPCTSILKKYYEGKLKNNQRGGMKLVSISAVRLVIIVMVAYVIVLVQSDSTFIFLAPVSSTNVKIMACWSLFIGELFNMISLSIVDVVFNGLFVTSIPLTTSYSLFLFKRSCGNIYLNYRNQTMDVSRLYLWIPSAALFPLTAITKADNTATNQIIHNL